MLYHIENILTEEDIQYIYKEIMCSNEWQDGMKSANYGGELVKKNLQLDPMSVPNSKKGIESKIFTNIAIQNRFFTRRIHNMLFSRTGEGMFYGAHTDKPTTTTGRRDISFTIFLNDPKEYDGGELILYINPEVKKVKLNAGQAIFYPTKYIHEVKSVNHGERVACVGWIESDIENHEEREILTNLQQSVVTMQNFDRQSANILNQSYNVIYKKFMN